MAIPTLPIAKWAETGLRRCQSRFQSSANTRPLQRLGRFGSTQFTRPAVCSRSRSSSRSDTREFVTARTPENSHARSNFDEILPSHIGRGLHGGAIGVGHRICARHV